MFIRALLVCCFLTSISAASAAVQLVLPLPSPGSVQNVYVETLLRESFATLELSVDIRYRDNEMNTSRVHQSLKRGQHINLAWLGVRFQHDADLIAIPFPIYQNILGQRILLIQQGRQSEFSQITSLEQLAAFTGLQHRSWSDYDVLVSNNLKVEGELSYMAMLKALEEGLADYFPRPVVSIVAELQRNSSAKVVIEQTLLLRYDNKLYFYTHKSDHQLAGQLAEGLANLQLSGRYDELFQQFHAEKLVGLELDSRRVLDLKP